MIGKFLICKQFEYETCNYECKTESQKCYGVCNKLKTGNGKLVSNPDLLEEF